MTTHIPRAFYSQEELDKLYPKELELQLVQIVRHECSRVTNLTSHSFCAMVNELQYHRVSRMYASSMMLLNNEN